MFSIKYTMKNLLKYYIDMLKMLYFNVYYHI